LENVHRDEHRGKLDNHLQDKQEDLEKRGPGTYKT